MTRVSASSSGRRLAAARRAAALTFLRAAGEGKAGDEESRGTVADAKEDVDSRSGETKLSASALF